VQTKLSFLSHKLWTKIPVILVDGFLNKRLVHYTYCLLRFLVLRRFTQVEL